jgi:hypothetical protein
MLYSSREVQPVQPVRMHNLVQTTCAPPHAPSPLSCPLPCRTSESDATDELLLLQDVAKDLRASGMRQFFIRDRQRKAIGAAILVADFR